MLTGRGLPWSFFNQRLSTHPSAPPPPHALPGVTMSQVFVYLSLLVDCCHHLSEFRLVPLITLIVTLLYAAIWAHFGERESFWILLCGPRELFFRATAWVQWPWIDRERAVVWNGSVGQQARKAHRMLMSEEIEPVVVHVDLKCMCYCVWLGTQSGYIWLCGTI